MTISRLIFLVIIVILIVTIKRKWSKKIESKHASQQLKSQKLSHADALTILGLKEPYTKADVNEAYKRLMNRVHPDKGGSEHFATQLNAARDLLVKKS